MLVKKFQVIQAGDTIVEVMFAIAVFALVATGSLAIMNRGVETTQRSLETSQVRKAMNDQAELLRYAQNDNSTLWTQLISSGNTENQASTFGHLVGGRCPVSIQQLGANKPFIIDQQTMTINRNNVLTPLSSVATPQLVYTNGVYQGTDGMWIEAVSHGQYVDFHIRACWDAPGSNVPSTLGTIVRLYAQ